MKISYNWLKNHIDLKESPEEISELLTNCGLEVEDLYEHEYVKGGLKGLIVGKVISVLKHPDADKLKLTKVDIGNGNILEIVCGAPNVKENQKVVVAPVGVTVFPLSGEPFLIKKAKIRGVESNGMICAEDEIGLSASHEGIMLLDEACEVGKKVTNYIKIANDHIFEIGITPNRGDATSHLGVARDLRALLNRKLNNKYDNKIETGENQSIIKIKIEEKELCEIYNGILIKNITVKESPAWLKEKLESIGLNTVNNIVDITNYILHDIGQPVHAFDFDKIKGDISVRKSIKSEKITTLSNEVKELSGNELIISDNSGPIALAGVIGGMSTCIDFKSKNIFLECACFDMSAVRKTSKITGINTDSSFRFERGVDPENTYNALIKTAKLIVENAGGELDFLPINQITYNRERPETFISYEKLKRILGVEINKKTLQEILTNLEMKVLEENNEGLKISIPLYRTDVTRDIDVFEDILRIYGFEKIELPETVNSAIVNSSKPDRHIVKQKIFNYLKSQGFNEIITNSLTSEKYYDDGENQKLVKLKNPLSNELAVMRYSMIPTLLEVVAYNKNRKMHDLKLFESGKVYMQTENGEFKEFEKISLIVTGNIQTPGWKQKPEKADYYYLKTILENSLKSAGVSSLKGHNISCIDDKMLKLIDVKGEVWYAEINFEKLISDISHNEFILKEIPIFPEVSRDLNLIIENKVKYSELENIIKKIAGKYLQRVSLTDIYTGKPLSENQKSYTFNIILYDNKKTMNDKQIDFIIQKLISTFENELGAIIRK